MCTCTSFKKGSGRRLAGKVYKCQAVCNLQLQGVKCFWIREVFGVGDLRDDSGLEGSGCWLASTTLARTYQQTCIIILPSTALGYVRLGCETRQEQSAKGLPVECCYRHFPAVGLKHRAMLHVLSRNCTASRYAAFHLAK